MNELNWNQASSQRSHDHQNSAQTVPKQAVGIVDMANSADVFSNAYRRQLELDAIHDQCQRGFNVNLSLSLFKHTDEWDICLRKAGYWC